MAALTCMGTKRRGHCNNYITCVQYSSIHSSQSLKCHISGNPRTPDHARLRSAHEALYVMTCLAAMTIGNKRIGLGTT